MDSTNPVEILIWTSLCRRPTKYVVSRRPAGAMAGLVLLGLAAMNSATAYSTPAFVLSPGKFCQPRLRLELKKRSVPRKVQGLCSVSAKLRDEELDVIALDIITTVNE